MPKAIIDTPQMIKTDFHNAFSMNKKIAFKFSSAQKIFQPIEKFNPLNLQNSAIKGERKNEYTQ